MQVLSYRLMLPGPSPVDTSYCLLVECQHLMEEKIQNPTFVTPARPQKLTSDLLISKEILGELFAAIQFTCMAMQYTEFFAPVP